MNTSKSSDTRTPTECSTDHLVGFWGGERIGPGQLWKKWCPKSGHMSLTVTHTHTQTFNGPFSGTTRVSRYQTGETNLDFTEARDSEWQWHQLGWMQVCTLLQTDNHASTPALSFLQARCPSCRPTNGVKALKALWPLWPLLWHWGINHNQRLVLAIVKICITLFKWLFSSVLKI